MIDTIPQLVKRHSTIAAAARSLLGCAPFTVVLGISPIVGQAAPVSFEHDIQPLFARHCVKCHGSEKQKGGLRLDRKASAFRGGDSGDPAIVPHHAGRSRLFQLASSGDDDERMPPVKGGGEGLNAEQLDLIQRWIDAGAEWPEPDGPPVEPARSEMKVTDEDRQHWSFRPLSNPPPPEPTDAAWAQTPVDPFIRARLEAEQLSPAPPADPRTLVRRLYFDLIGLPPAPARMEHWTAQIGGSPSAIRQLVDELLASNHYGERWARHWLDVARYADSDGQEGDGDRPNAYHFRDFVIRALNQDMPFDRFIRWQLAGDELAPDNPEAISATGFIVAGNSTVLNVPMEEEKLRNRANELDDMVSTTAQAMLGLTLACARCHDHKYDPLPTRDYYRIMRIFNSGDRTEVPLAPPTEIKAHRAALAAWESENNTARDDRDKWLKEVGDPFVTQVRAARIAKLKLSDEEKQLLLEQPESAQSKKLAKRFEKELKVEPDDYAGMLPPEQKARFDKLQARAQAAARGKPAGLPTAFAFADFAPEPRESWFFERGDFMARNEKMDIGFLSVLTRGKTPEDYWTAARKARLRPDTTQQRRAMAEWMTDLDHGAGTLLARVMVNRVWQHHFGEGLVRTVSDFGTRGDPPTHPELLEWLTTEFIASGWSLKHLHRLIVNSATYQQSAASSPPGDQLDPENRLLSRRRPLRLESEILRDSMLSVANTLNPEMFGPSFKPPIPAEAMQARNVKSPYPRDAKDSPATRRRTVYMFHKRVVQYPLMQAFDAPDAQVSCGRRLNTTVAPQALALLNDPFVRLRAGELAKRLASEAGDDPMAGIQLAFQLCLSREPAPGELAASHSFIAAQTRARAQHDNLQAPDAYQLALTDFCQSLFGINEFIYVD